MASKTAHTNHYCQFQSNFQWSYSSESLYVKFNYRTIRSNYIVKHLYKPHTPGRFFYTVTGQSIIKQTSCYSSRNDRLHRRRRQDRSIVFVTRRQWNAHLTHGSLDPHESAPTISGLVKPFCPTHTDHGMCDMCSDRPHLCVAGTAY